MGISFSTSIVGTVLWGEPWEGDGGWEDEEEESEERRASEREEGCESIHPMMVRGEEEKSDWREEI